MAAAGASRYATLSTVAARKDVGLDRRGGQGVSEYNYEVFPLDLDMDDFHAFPSVLTVGERAPDGELVDAASGDSVRLASLWRSGPVLLEFGSIT